MIAKLRVLVSYSRYVVAALAAIAFGVQTQ
jgi:hypothetical protein